MVQSAIGVFIVFVEFLIPLMILMYCYGRILWIIKARIGSKMASGNTQTAKFELARNNVIKTLFIVAFFFIICFIGIEVYYLLYGLGFEVELNGWLYNFTVGMFFLNCTVNPFIYLVNYKDFQQALIGQFCCRISRHENNSEVTGSTICVSVAQPSNGNM